MNLNDLKVYPLSVYKKLTYWIDIILVFGGTKEFCDKIA